MEEAKNITLIILIALVVLIGIDWYRLDNKVIRLEKELMIKDETIERFKEANRVANNIAATKTEIVEKEVVRIQKQYVPQIKYVKEYVRDENKSDCEGARDLLNSFVY